MAEQLVSIVIATYNMGEYLPYAVQSVLDQNWDNLEVIIVDDGSSDNTSDIVQLFSEDPRVRYIRTESRGQPHAKNRGIQEASGDFIAFCDADDMWCPGKLERQITAFEDQEVGVVYSEASEIDRHGAPIAANTNRRKRYSGYVTAELLYYNFVPFGTAVIRRKCIDQSGMFDESFQMGIDWDLWLRYSVNWKFTYIPETTYQYRVWGGQMSGNYRGRYSSAFKILHKFLSEHPGFVSISIQRRAWADMYIQRGLIIAGAENSFFEPLSDILTGISRDITYRNGWRALAKLLIGRV